MKQHPFSQQLGIIFLCCCVLLSAEVVRAQGCSDAGVCSIGSMHSGNNATDTSSSGSIGISLFAGKGDGNTAVYVAQLETTLQLLTNTSVQLKLPYTVITGSLGTISGLGDISAAFTHSFFPTENFQLSANVGVRIATNTASRSSNGVHLPMQYQTSLGTTDILLGVATTLDSVWFIALGAQVPVIQNNQNTFDTSTTSLPSSLASSFPSSYMLERSSDISVRIERILQFNQWQLAFGVLPIIHLNNDTYTTPNGRKEALIGSQGLTLNLTVSGKYYFSKYFDMRVLFAAPVIVRDIRPDGLTRSVLGNVSLYYTW